MLHRNHAARSGLAALAALGLALLAGACRPESTILSSAELSAADTTGFTPIALAQAQSDMAQSGIRIEVHVRPGSAPLVATQLALGPANMSGEPEQVQANITALDETGGTITLDLGGLEISFDDNTQFSSESVAGATPSSTTLSRDAFVAAVRAGLAAGRRQHVAVRRAPPTSPQAPDDGSFLADQIRLGGNAEVWMIGLNAGPASLLLNTSPPPDAFLKLLGLTIEIRLSDGTTRIGRKHDVVGQRIEFGGEVKAVYLDRGAFLLASGLAVRVTDQTVIADHDGILTLADVDAALAAGAKVIAEGAGTIESRDPKVVAALRLKFTRHRPHFEFRDYVKAVDPDARRMTLGNGAVLCFNDQSVIAQDGDLTSLEQVARALAADRRVGAAGVATPGPGTTDCRATVLKVRFSLLPPPVLEFRDGVKSVDLEHQKLTLVSGAVICFAAGSEIWQEGELDSLDDVARALEAGKRVFAAGTATPGPNDAGCRATVLRAKFGIVEPPPPPVIEFHDGVKAVDAAARTITLSSGPVLCLNQQSVINQDSDLKTLADVAAALQAGKAVKAEGTATPNPDATASNAATCRAIVLRVKFGIRT